MKENQKKLPLPTCSSDFRASVYMHTVNNHKRAQVDCLDLGSDMKPCLKVRKTLKQW